MRSFSCAEQGTKGLKMFEDLDLDLKNCWTAFGLV